MLIALFELCHIMIIGIAVRLLTGFHILETQFGSLFLLVSFVMICIVNYFYFIRRKKIFRINEYYQSRESKSRKGYVLFLLYWLILFMVLYIESYVFTHGYYPILN